MAARGVDARVYTEEVIPSDIIYTIVPQHICTTRTKLYNMYNTYNMDNILEKHIPLFIPAFLSRKAL